MRYEDEGLGVAILELGGDLLSGAFLHIPVLMSDWFRENIRGHCWHPPMRYKLSYIKVIDIASPKSFKTCASWTDGSNGPLVSFEARPGSCS
jgi:hypothetical protein